MTLPVSNYEDLLDQVQKLTQETILLQEQLSADLIGAPDDSADVNHNLALIQKNYERGIELADSVLERCEQTELCQTSQASSLSAPNIASLPQRRSEGYSVGLKIPPGDPYSRLNVWRNKNRHLFSQDQQSGSPSHQDAWERRRPLSLHGPREELLFGPGASWASHNPPPSLSDSCLGPPPASSSSLQSLHRPSAEQTEQIPSLLRPTSSGISTPDSYAKSTHSYELDESSTEDDSRPSSSLQAQRLPKPPNVWPVKRDSWGSTQSVELPAPQIGSVTQKDLPNAMSMSSTAGMNISSSIQGQRRLGAKMDVVYSLLSMLGSTEGRDDMSATLLSMSNSVDSCLVMRQSGCLPLLIQLIHAPGQDPETRERASRALYNIVHARGDEKSSRREARVLRLLEQIRDYCQMLRNSLETMPLTDDETDRHPGATIAALMKLSFDESHRHAMCLLGGLHAVAELIEMDHIAHGSECEDPNCITLRRYGGMALTNLTFGDSNNKALLCSFRQFMKALVSQLRSSSDDLRQVTASVLRNLSWRADSSSKQTLREVAAVAGLMKAAMEGRKESTLKSILSALWNLSAHCTTNKMDICAVEGSLAFLVDMLSYNAPSKTLAIVENAGGILRNISSHIAVRDDYRAIVRERGCLQVLLRQLRSPSLTVVSNACGALWNLSARCPQDQKLLWDLGAVPMLRSLIHSKHKMIAMGSSAALKNLLSARPNGTNIVHLDSTARGLGLPSLPSLMARKQKALEQEIDHNLAETCDNIEPSNSPVNKEDKFTFRLEQTLLDTPIRSGKSLHQPAVYSTYANQPGTSGIKTGFARSDSRESMRSVTSTQSDTIFEKVNRHASNGVSSLDLQSTSVHSPSNYDSSKSSNGRSKALSEKKYTLRYMNAIPERLKPGDPLPDLRGLKYTDSTISWATAPNQDITCPKGLLHSSVDDNFSITNSGSSKNITPESSTYNLLGARAKSTIVTHSNIPQKNMKVTSPLADSSKVFAEIALNQQTDCSLKYASDDDKQSSAYYTGTDPDTGKTYCAESTPYQSSLNSSRASSISDAHEDGKVKMNFRKLREPQKFSYASKLPTADALIGQNLKDESHKVSRNDSLRSNTTSNSEKTLNADEYKSLESDSAIFEGERRQGENSDVPSFSSLGNELEEDLQVDNTLVRYKTNASLNNIDIQDANDDASDQTSPLASLENYGQQHLQDDEDFSEMTHTIDDYYTVQDTYTVGKNVDKNPQSPCDDDCTISTMTFTSIDDKDTRSNCLKSGIETSETLTENMHTAVTSNSESCESFDSIERSEHHLLELCIQSGVSNPEALLSTGSRVASKSRTTADVTDNSTDTMVTAKDSKTVSQQEEVTGKKEEEYRRQRDPDAMIASLDRLTAALVQQTEAMREREFSAMKSSLPSDQNTWNEDSPNDFSFPSISMSAPLVASFKSDVDQITDEGSLGNSMTESRIIEMEANKLAAAVSADVNQVSLTHLDLDAINPPSNMGSLVSLTTSIGGTTDIVDISGDKSRCNSNSLPPMYSSGGRKKSLPMSGVVARRALNHGQNCTGSLENLLNEYANANNSQLENVKPPSVMDELLDVADMENSMLSVASITSEIADCKENDSNSLTGSDTVFDFIKPVANVLSMTCLRNIETMEGSANNSLSECLDNINPPSLFNEISRIENSTLETNTHCSETLCADADVYSEDATHCVFDERIEEIANDTDDGVTPLSSEYNSSMESTPKKRLSKNLPGHLTPKQKRQLTKERYKTYTIAAERIRKEQQEFKKQEQANEEAVKNLGGKCSPFTKRTPKQRRQEDRARFQTQVLDSPTINTPTLTNDATIENENTKVKSTEKSGIPSLVKTGIPMFRKLNGTNTYKINRSTSPGNANANGESDVITVAQSVNEKNVNIFVKAKFEGECMSLPIMEPTSLINGVSKKLSNQTLPQGVEAKHQEFFAQDKNELEESHSESDNDSDKEDANQVKGRPRIVKPGTLSRDLSVESNGSIAEKSEPEAPKGIRGRRKPLYSTPNTRKSTPQSSPLKQSTAIVQIPISRSNTSPIVRATRTLQLRQVNSFQKSNSTPKMSANAVQQLTTTTPTQAKRSSIPQKGLSIPVTAEKVESSVKPLERQGTFTKDEPEMDNTHMVLPMSPCNSKLIRPIFKLSPKTTPIQTKSKISMRTPQKPTTPKLTKTTSVEKIATPTGIPSIAKRSSTNLGNTGVVKSSSNYQIVNLPNESGIPRKVSLGPRSNSNSSIVSNSSNQGTRKMVKETTSRIASLWKKVEEKKKKQGYERPDTRQWITHSRDSTEVDTNGDEACKLYRSSTFEGITNDSANSR
ncbi:uncharacterized protein LOC131663102 isoform X2 [Phymastichus coffea]|uniref:uncharacterized protein LOC131663102 isoform X2 n=1 Tax=Phymastichus coffea TaxID=108790 RepID=UPI00273C0B55|nr:uncharacterized protein LOC131663102 isoform X2 [Phymastichus coffea]